MKIQYIIASLAIHAAIICPIVGFFHLHPPSSPNQEQPIPIFFEIVEEALPSVSDEQSGTVRDNMEIVPDDVETVPDDMSEDMGTVLDDMETVSDDMSEDVRSVPDDTEAVPIKNTENDKISDIKAEETESLNESVEHAKIVSDPVALNRIIPVYPRSARRRGHEGCVTVEIFVAEDGHVSGAEIVSSSGHAELDSAALGAVRTAKFAPATEDGASVTGRLRLTFNFKLE